MDSGFQVLDFRFQILDSGFFVSGLKFQIPFISGIPDSLSCIRDSKAKDLGFY